MIKSVPRGMACFQRRALNAENLPIFNNFLSMFRLILVNNHLRTKTLEIRDATDMIRMPVCEKSSLHCCVFF